MANFTEPVLKFINVDESIEKNLRRACQVSQEYELRSEWISTSLCDVKGLDLKADSSVFVLALFEGEIFEYLKRNNCRIVGPQCILSCLQTETSLPSVKHPVFSIAMRGCYVSCTSVPRQERDHLHELIQLMGGVYMKDFTSSVTHLVAGEVGSKKYRVACSFNKPILLPDWVYKCWERGINSHVCACDQEFMDYKCPIFKGVTLCVTGIDADKRKEVKSLVAQHGGIYSGELNMNTCTHLLVNTPKGMKYDSARRWNIHCVSTQWFYESIQYGYCLDESNFLTLLEDNDQHNGSRVRSRLSTSLIANGSSVLHKSCTEKKISNKAAQAAYMSAQKHGNGDLLSSSVNKKLSNKTYAHSTSVLSETHVSELESSDFEVSIQPGNLFLDGCKIYLSGFSGEKLEKLRKIINSGGGTRFNQINEIVSHVIIGERVEADLELLKNYEFQVYIVMVQWILESARKGERLPEKDYLCVDLIQKEDLSLSSKENKDPVEKPTTKLSKHKSNPQQKVSDGEKGSTNTGCQEENDDVFLQYMPQNTDKVIESEETKEESRDTAIPSNDPDATLDDESDCAADGCLLSGRYFTIAGFGDEDVEYLWQLIESNGGKALKSKETRVADFAILNINTVPKEDIQAKQLATICWLEQSVERGTLLNVDDSFLFKPFNIPEGCQPLQGCVLSISQFRGFEADHMNRLAELLGAQCQDYFVRKASSKHLVNTHLLCQKPDGNKYLAAINWKIPVVTKEWLFACAATGILVPVEKYAFRLEDKEDGNEIECVPLEDPYSAETGSQSASVSLEVWRCSPEEEAAIMETSDATSVVQPELCLEKEVTVTKTVTMDDLTENDRHLSSLPLRRPPFHNRPFRPSFDLTDVMQELASPVVSSLRSRKSRGSRNSFPLDDFFAENIQQTLSKLGGVAPHNKKGEEIAYEGLESDDQQGHGGLRCSPKQGILAGIVLSASKKLAHQHTELYTIASSLGADYRWLFDDSCSHLIHQGSANDKTKELTRAKDRGIHIVSPYWLYTCQEKHQRVDETLYPHTYNPKLSLSVVTTGRRLTRSSKIVLEQEISPKKVKKAPALKDIACCNENVPDKSRSSGSGSVESKQTKEVSGEQGVAEEAAEQQPVMGPATLESLEARDDFKRQLEAIMDATKGKGRRKSRRHTSTSSSTNTSHSTSGNGVMSAETSLATRRTSARLRSRGTSKGNEGVAGNTSSRVKSREHATDDSEHSHSDTITYDDPAGRMERDRIMAQLKRGCSPCSEIDTEDQEEDKACEQTHKDAQPTSKEFAVVADTTAKAGIPVEQLSMTIRSDPPSPLSSSTPVAPPIALQIKEAPMPEPVNLLDATTLNQSQPRAMTTPKFQLSVMTPQEKIDYSALIEQLGGTVFDTVYFNPGCTHVVVGKPNRNEKYLAAVAAGKWVLHKSFLEASREAGFFVSEVPHEWGVDIPGEPSNKLAAAAHRWRIRLLQERTAASEMDQGTHCRGAFSGWKVLLCVDKSRQPGFKRLLEAGGAKVSSVRPPFKNAQDCSHAFLDLSKTKVDAADLQLLHQANVWCLKPDYIAEYLMQEPPPPPQKYLLAEVATLVESDRHETTLTRKRKGGELTGDDKRVRL